MHQSKNECVCTDFCANGVKPLGRKHKSKNDRVCTNFRANGVKLQGWKHQSINEFVRTVNTYYKIGGKVQIESIFVEKWVKTTGEKAPIQKWICLQRFLCKWGKTTGAKATIQKWMCLHRFLCKWGKTTGTKGTISSNLDVSIERYWTLSRLLTETV